MDLVLDFCGKVFDTQTDVCFMTHHNDRHYSLLLQNQRHAGYCQLCPRRIMPEGGYQRFPVYAPEFPDKLECGMLAFADRRVVVQCYEAFRALVISPPLPYA
jgi:hypothetical protein